MLDVALLGTGGMMPLPERYLTSLICRYNGKLLLIDCGEGTQVTNKILGWGYKSIDVICFTHVHGDHITGLPGMLLTIGNSGRIEPITIIGPIGIETVVTSLLIIAPDLPFSLTYIEIPEVSTIIQINDFYITTLPVDHRIQCIGYSVEIKRVGKFSPEKAFSNNVPKEIWGKLQQLETVTFEENIFTPNMVLGSERAGIKVCYITDTRPTDDMVEFVSNADLFVGEGIYGDDDKLEKAIKHKHMTFSESATIAKNGNVSELWLTHFSPALKEPSEFLHVATDIFPNTKVGEDRLTKTIFFKS